MIGSTWKRRGEELWNQPSFLFSLSWLGWLCVLAVQRPPFSAPPLPFVARVDGTWYFPHFRAGDATALSPTGDFRALAESEAFQRAGGKMLFPLIPYDPSESLLHEGGSPPSAPSRRHWFGTDDRGRDVAARFLFGLRYSLLFALSSWLTVVAFACCTGIIGPYRGGKIDLLSARLTEIWDTLPPLYVALFLLSLWRSSFFLVCLIWSSLSWVVFSRYLRAEVLRIKALPFMLASRGLGVSEPRLILHHVVPHLITPVLVFSPFLWGSAITGLAALDFLGLGLPPPLASWGELLRQGKGQPRRVVAFGIPDLGSDFATFCTKSFGRWNPPRHLSGRELASGLECGSLIRRTPFHSRAVPLPSVRARSTSARSFYKRRAAVERLPRHET